MQDITDASHTQRKMACKEFKMKNLAEYLIYPLKVIHFCWLMDLTNFLF